MAIARFLDHADEQIQRYITSKERLIALLEEERQALVHQAVTRGLNPSVSGSSHPAWSGSGDVPEHWQGSRSKSTSYDRYTMSGSSDRQKEDAVVVSDDDYDY